MRSRKFEHNRVDAMVSWLKKALDEGKIRDGTTSTGTPAFWRTGRHVKKSNGNSSNIVYSPETDSTPNILNRSYFDSLNRRKY